MGGTGVEDGGWGAEWMNREEEEVVVVLVEVGRVGGREEMGGRGVEDGRRGEE